ncbi:helix-turn-helix transcriptional regulator [Rhodococcoides corynebacterioides]|uniref:Helix-turn-helix transcriptional regulator n=1 Tax=Rhodococcoides corynebacterioides TaxID=53972 RepID=A0ABS7NYJ4_9NOCA|nr:helix-turn-helix transcriptional regulator [Rhodococcus corynebacterioides]MBY6365222.1 helix-turn-helix transcriptional regulator [Rhodococcus corynebacterioides]MBY6406634.1 helix-turn-helix transcriptional regulator [Rhodococcus corynebacterioides]
MSIDPENDLHQILDLMTDWVPFVACSVASYDPVARRHTTVASRGYPDAVLEHLDGWFVTRDEAFSFMARIDPTPRRWRDFPFDYRGSFSIREVFAPHGYRDGTTMLLHTRDGRYTGCLHVNIDSVDAFTADDAEHLHRLQGIIGALVDRRRAVAVLASTMSPTTGGAALVRSDGSVTAVSGTEPSRALTPGSGLVSVLLRGGLRGFDRSVRWRDDDGCWHTVSTRPVAEGLLVREAPEPLPFLLTSAELHVLDGVSRGLSNGEIASSIGCSARAVGKHLEHVFPKIGVRSRAHAAVLAASEGLTVVR